jgi:hypothetical protein
LKTKLNSNSSWFTPNTTFQCSKNSYKHMGQHVLKRWTIFTIRASLMEIELKFGKSWYVFDFRKLNKIARCGIKIQEFAWRYEIQFGALFMLATSSKSPQILN